ncbi:MAG: TIGR01777 family oxidoreductase [Acidimicrobiales bacterium]
MKVAVTGSSGLIGRTLTASLHGDGHEVVAVVRPGSMAQGPKLSWDIEAATIEASELEGVDAVVHLAGEGIGDKRWNPQHKRAVIESRTKGTTLIAETLAGLSSPPRVVVSASAIGYYGDRGDEILTEASAPGEVFLSEVCTAWEAATRPAADAGIRVAHLRTGLVVAPKGGFMGKLLPLVKLGLGGRLGPGSQWWSWISLTDEVAAIRFLLDHEVEGPVNLTAPEPVTNAAFTKALGSLLHRPTFLAVPAFGPRLLLGREMADELLFASQRVLPTVLEREGFRFSHSDVGAGLRAELGR